MVGRTKFFTGICFFLSAFWVFYLFYLQMYDPFNLNTLKIRRYNPHKEFIIANRGNIYDQKGAILVGSLKYYQLDIDVGKVRADAQRHGRSDVVYLGRIADIISTHTEIKRGDVYDKLTKSKNNTVVISENIDENQLIKITEDINKEPYKMVMTTAFSSAKRIFTKGTLAGRLIGMTQGVTDNTTRYNRYTFRLDGLNGIEKAFNNDLLGIYGWRETMRDGYQRLLPLPNPAEKPVTHGSSIYLTIDSDIQEILEDNLYKGLTQYSAKNGIGVIMSPKTGNIIAMAGVNVDDRKLNDNQIRSLQNMPTQFLYEPGSTMKPFVTLYALEKGLFRENDMFDCSPYRPSYSKTRVIKDSHELGRISLRDVITQSSNVGIAKVAERIGSADLYRHYLNMGFGTATSVDLSFESSGRLAKVKDWTPYTLHSVSFGQEMQVTVLQLATAYCALANGGQILKPNIISKKVDDSGRVYFTAEKRVMRTVSNKNAIELNNSFMLDVVERGTGSNTKFQNIKIAGKTGTSEKVVDGRYSRRYYTASFAGFFPYENPEYVMVIVYDEPAYNYRFGSQSAAMTFRKVVEEMLTLPTCDVIPDMKLAAQEIITMPQLIGMRLAEAKQVLAKHKINAQLYNERPNSYIVQQYPQAGTQFGNKNTVSLYCNTEMGNGDEDITAIAYGDDGASPLHDQKMPSLVGLSVRQAINISKALKIQLAVEGSGHIVSQSISEGETVRLQQRCLVVAR